MRKYFIIIAAGIITVLGGALPSISASAAPISHHVNPSKRDFTSQVLQSRGTGTLSMTADGTSGDGVFGKTYADGSNQQTSLLAENACGGGHAVTTTCPFSNHTLDQGFQGQEIITLQRSNTPHLCYAAGTTSGFTNNIYQKSCGSAGYLWVLLENSCTSGNYCEFVNVYATDNSSSGDTLEYVCTNGLDANLHFGTSVTNDACNWTATN